jgi:predicted transcriptional regulator of viral defense system
MSPVCSHLSNNRKQNENMQGPKFGILFRFSELTAFILGLNIGTQRIYSSANIKNMENTIRLQKLETLLSASSFTSTEAKALGVSSALLSYYVKTGRLVRIGHGIYQGINAPTVENFRWEDLANAMLKVRHGVICLVSALALYELTDEIPRQHWIAIPNNTRHRADYSVKIIRLRNIELGRTFFTIDQHQFLIFDRERTIVDSFRYLGAETALKALRAAIARKGDEKIDLKKLRQYAKILRVNIDPYLLMVTT